MTSSTVLYFYNVLLKNTLAYDSGWNQSKEYKIVLLPAIMAMPMVEAEYAT